MERVYTPKLVEPIDKTFEPLWLHLKGKVFCITYLFPFQARLGGSEGRCRALEASLAVCETGKREAEAKLSSVAHALRRVAGVQPDGSVQAGARRRLSSPARRCSPHRGLENKIYIY